jgi:hypothetical protein
MVLTARMRQTPVSFQGMGGIGKSFLWYDGPAFILKKIPARRAAEQG